MSDSSGMPRVLAVAWGLEKAPQRGPSRGLTHEAIVSAAVDIADADGLDAVTMSRVARALGFTPMSLYRYVSTKDDLVLLMQDGVAVLPEASERVVTGPDVGNEGVEADALARLRAFAEGLRTLYRAHPWLIDVRRSALAVLMPGSMRIADLGLAACGGLRLDDGERVATVLTLSSYVSASVGLERDMGGEAQVLLDDVDWTALGSAVIGSGRYPRVAPMMLAGEYAAAPAAGAAETTDPTDPDLASGVDADFDFGLERLLDGLIALHRTRASDEPVAGG